MGSKESFKVVVVGDTDTGKTALIKRISPSIISKEDYADTIGASFGIKVLEVNNTPVRLQIWDLAAAERFHFLLPTYCANAHGVILVFDLTRPSTFLSLEKWLQLINKNVDAPKIILVGTKLDLGQKIDDKTINLFLEKHREIDLFYKTSSKTGENSEKVFTQLSHLLITPTCDTYMYTEEIREVLSKTIYDIERDFPKVQSLIRENEFESAVTQLDRIEDQIDEINPQEILDRIVDSNMGTTQSIKMMFESEKSELSKKIDHYRASVNEKKQLFHKEVAQLPKVIISLIDEKGIVPFRIIPIQAYEGEEVINRETLLEIFQFLLNGNEIEGFLNQEKEKFISFLYLEKQILDHSKIYTKVSLEEIASKFEVPVNIIQELCEKMILSDKLSGCIDPKTKELIKEQKVVTVEKPLSSPHGAVNKAVIISKDASDVLSENLISDKTGEGLVIKRRFIPHGETLMFSFLVENRTPYVAHEVEVKLDYPKDILKLEGAEGSNTEGSLVYFRKIRPGEARTATYYLKPIICTVSKIGGILFYRDHQDRKIIRDLPSKIIEACRFVQPKSISLDDFRKERGRNTLKKDSVVIANIEDLNGLIQEVKKICGLFLVSETEDSAYFSGVSLKHEFFGLEIKKQGNDAEITVLSPERKLIIGVLSEIYQKLSTVFSGLDEEIIGRWEEPDKGIFSEEIVQKRRIINTLFEGQWGVKLFRENELATQDVAKQCKTENDFNNRIQSLSCLIDELYVADLKKFIKNVEKDDKSIKILEKFLNENVQKYSPKIMENLRTISRLRSKKIHKDDHGFHNICEKLGESFPPNWENLWLTLLSLYFDSLELLEESLRAG